MTAARNNWHKEFVALYENNPEELNKLLGVTEPAVTYSSTGRKNIDMPLLLITFINAIKGFFKCA